MPVEVIVVLCLSYAAAAYLGFRLVRREISVGWKVTYAALLMVPVLGPLSYVWVSSFPEKLPKELNGELGGLGGAFLSRELSEKDGERDISDVFSDENRSQERERLRRRRNRKRN